MSANFYDNPSKIYNWLVLLVQTVKQQLQHYYISYLKKQVIKLDCLSTVKIMVDETEV